MASHCKPIKYSPKRGDKKDQKKGNKLKGFFPKLNFGSVYKISPNLDEKTFIYIEVEMRRPISNKMG